MKKIIAFSGSNSVDSINQELVRIAASMIEGVEVEVIDLREYDAPIFSKALEAEIHLPETIIALKKKLKEGDGYIIASPEHNSSIPAFFKNILDWISRENGKMFNDRPALVMATSNGKRGGISVLEHLSKGMLPYRGTQVTGAFSLPTFNQLVEEGEIKDSEKKEELQNLLTDLVKTIDSQ